MAMLLNLLLLAAAIIFFLLKRNGNRAKKANLPPSPPKLPIIGNLHQLGALPHRSLRSHAHKHGPMMLLHLGQVPTLVISSAEMAEEILKANDLVFASRPSTTAAKLLSYGCTGLVFTPYGEYWRQVRRICVVELLGMKRVNSFRWIREEEVGLMIKKISRSCSTGEAINLTELLLSFSSGIIMKAALGEKFEGGGEEGKRNFSDLVTEGMVMAVTFCLGDYFPFLAWVDVLTGFVAKLKKFSCEVDAFLEWMIENHLREAEKHGGVGEEQRNFVDVLLQVQEDSPLGLTRNNLKAIILDMLGGAIDTTAVTLEWAMAELIKHPIVMKKAQEEVRSVVGRKEKVDEEDLHQMHYLKFVIKETLRLHPVAPLLVPLESTSDVVIKGYHIPAKTRVLINAFAIGRDLNSWENAEEFHPDRFANNPVDFKGKDFQLIPFGAGRRSCPGMSFGINSVEVALANLLYWFNWELPDGLITEDLDMSESLGLVVHMKVPLHLVPKHFFS